MKKHILQHPILVILFMMLCMISCNTDEMSVQNNDDIYDLRTEIAVVKIPNRLRALDGSNNETIALQFRNKEVYDKTIEVLEDKSVDERLEWLGNFPEFESLLAVYNQAMTEAEALDFTESEYNAFKEKYKKHLYFPEHLDDFGAYLPILEVEKASIVNPDGIVLIGNNTILESQIESYNDLQLSGQALYMPETLDDDVIPYDLLEVDTRSSNSSSKTKIWAERMKIPGGLFGDNKQKIGDSSSEYVRNWERVGKGKRIRVTFGRIFRIRKDLESRIDFHSEVSFRKRGFMRRWYNYRSETSFTARVRYNDGGVAAWRYWAKGHSSHDGYRRCAHTEIIDYKDKFIVYNSRKRSTTIDELHKSDSNKLRLYKFPGYTVDMEVTYRGMPQTLYLSHTVGDEYGYTTNKSGLKD